MASLIGLRSSHDRPEAASNTRNILVVTDVDACLFKQLRRDCLLRHGIPPTALIDRVNGSLHPLADLSNP
jgi:hypothetical protein